MPWSRYYWRRRRRFWRHWRPRPRKTFRRRYRRRRNNWVRKKKLKTLLLKEYQPDCIRKCKIKGTMPLLWGTVERFINNYDSYELTAAPPQLPSGGLFSIKNISLESLFSENKYLRNVWTKTNNELPMMRYTGCKLKIFASEYVDLIMSYDTSLPLRSNLLMYHSMHPGIHFQLPHRKIIPRKNYTTRTKPYHTFKIRPPKPLTNKWYFQAEMAKTPLIQLRTSVTTLDEFFIGHKAISTTISIYYLNLAYIENLNFKNFPNDGYWCRRSPAGTHPKLYLVTFQTGDPNTAFIKDLIFLGNSRDNQPGKPISTIEYQESQQLAWWMQHYNKYLWGNPFYKTYLQKQKQVYIFSDTLSNYLDKYSKDRNAKVTPNHFTEIQLTDVIRYNSLNDKADETIIYFKSVTTENESLDPPTDDTLYSENLPIWVLHYGFTDFMKRQGRLKHIDNEYVLLFKMKYETPTARTYLILDPDFISGKSPYEKQENPLDHGQWYPCYQFQQQTSNTIAYSGQGSPKIPVLEAVQAKLQYCFYFKWGGNPPQMSTISDPKNQPFFHLPTNILQNHSLQNPTTAPELYLFNFDERRQTITQKALKRLQKDYQFTEPSFSSTERFLPPIQSPQESSSETTSEEETEETQKLLHKLHKQQRKHKLLKLRIMEMMGYLPKSE
nr:MAG: ORF1 [TTV-like mini virus]